MLLTEQIDEAYLQVSSEIDATDFALQLTAFRRRHAISTISDAAEILRNMSIDMR